MRIGLGNQYRVSRGTWRDQRGITGLETAIVLIAFIVVAAVFAFAVLTTGLFSTEKAKETSEAALGEAQSTLAPKGSVIARSTDDTNVSTIEIQLTNAVNADSVALSAGGTLLTYSDPDQRESIRGDQGGAIVTGWTRLWSIGAGDGVDSGEIVRITVTLAAGTLLSNTQFTVEILPVQGAVIRIQRTTPIEIATVMDLS